MSESVITRPHSGASPGGDDRRDPLLPAGAQHGLGRQLRRIAGVDERVLDWVPQERHRYARLGAIVLNTALMAALSMSVLLGSVDMPVWLIAPVALIWGYLILSFDGWLVASTHGVLGMARLRIFLPRLFISVLMGAVIAEPLLLKVFGPAIHTEINAQRKSEIDDYESRLKQCNPVALGAVIPEGCGDFQLNVADSPAGVRNELALADTERAKLQTLIGKINTELTKREDLARAECNGDPGPGLSNRRGEGPNCRRDRREADRYRASSGLDAHQADLIKVNRRIDVLTARDGTISTAYAQALNTEILQKVREKRDTQEQIGILDEDKALGVLTSQSLFVLIGSWLLRLLLVTIDCLPVLTKLMSRPSTYDALIGRQLDISNRLHEKTTTLHERHDAGRADVAMRRDEHRVRTEMAALEDLRRGARADREADLDNQIEELAARLRKAGG
ncbi:DUF4407 domain-containing protein [Actinoplanes sp. NEAU-A12]|uniref:DUF4407 domain-containing protein n=1 Tax=Actinoplanes sandaracinus TaxID=3045177 RepID=A0ABT6WEM6_9ACTN|nr:DUF4407 domain-containing protein [Actinoplanes sandaracinus]MDI6098170.1 DUF4407 domain-containing protein [Actinoplanes sandaracinus]